MQYQQIKCLKKRRLFDVQENSRLRILIKCDNQKTCPHKTGCQRLTKISHGFQAEPPVSAYYSIDCPHCSRRLFDVSRDSSGMVHIKCCRCGQPAVIPISAAESVVAISRPPTASIALHSSILSSSS